MQGRRQATASHAEARFSPRRQTRHFFFGCSSTPRFLLNVHALRPAFPSIQYLPLSEGDDAPLSMGFLTRLIES
jgi:hypothetical protein